jgi:MHS family proline/betaine transporter-like MFS transporter
MKKQILFCVIGTILEWYDFSLFASLAAIISSLFFPHKSQLAAMIWTFSIFASGFIMRPIGAIFFGHLGDKIGRKSSLLITVILMAFSTTAIGFIPVDIGILTVVLLMLLRLLQGFAASGEYPGGLVLLYELANPKHKGLITSLGAFSSVFGIFLGTLVCTITSKCLSSTDLLNWGWRIPFIIGLPLGLIGYALRKYLFESSVFEQVKKQGMVVRLPFVELIKYHWKNFITLTVMYILSNVAFYMSFVYLSTYTVNTHRISIANSFYLNALSTLIYAAFILIAGYLSDHINRKYMMRSVCLLMLIFAIPFFWFVINGSAWQQVVCQALLSLLIGMLVGTLAIFAVELFPANIRYTGVATALNIGASFFGGTAPLVCTWLAKLTGAPNSAAYYLMGIALLALIVLRGQSFKFVKQEINVLEN